MLQMPRALRSPAITECTYRADVKTYHADIGLRFPDLYTAGVAYCETELQIRATQ